MALVGTYTYEEGTNFGNLAAGNGVVSVFGTCVYRTVDAVHGTLGWRSTDAAYLRYNTPAQTHSGSVYFTPRTYATGSGFLVRWLSDTTTSQGAIRINSAGRLVIVNGSNVEQVAPTTLVTVAGTRYRLDWQMTVSGANTTVTARLFAGANVEGATPDDTIAATTWSFSNPHIYVGIGSTVTGWVIGFDTLRLYTTAQWAGPYAGGTAGTVQAGVDQTSIEPGSTVLMSTTTTGTGTMVWTQVAGPTVALSGSGTNPRTFTAPATWDGATLTFQVDFGGDSDTVDVAVLPHNRWRKTASGWQPIFRSRVLTPTVVVAPNAPTGFGASGTTASTTTLSWTAATLPAGAAAVSGYRVYSGSTLMSSVGAVTSTTIVGLTASTTYPLIVKAYNGTESSASNSINVTTSPVAGNALRPVVVPMVGTTAPKLLVGSSTGLPLRLKGVAVWPFDDVVTRSVTVSTTPFWQNQFNNRSTIVATIKSWGANCIRLRVLADAYNNQDQGITKAVRLGQIVTMRDAITSQGLYCILTGWDSLDGSMEDANWASNYSNAFQFWADVRNALKISGVDDPMVIYEPFNKPNQVTDAQWMTAMQATVNHFRSVLGYRGVLMVDTNRWSHTYDDTRLTALEAYDAGMAAMGGTHQLVFCKHDHGDEYPDKDAYTQATWLANDGLGGSSPWVFTKHLVIESEFGNYNTDGLSHPVWAAGACTNFAAMLTDGTRPTFVGAIPFVYGPWSDGNAITATDNITTTTWGGYVKNNLLLNVTPPNAPTGLAASGTTGTTTNLSWTAATLPAGAAAITAYRVYNGGTLLSTVGAVTSTTLSGLSASTTYSLTVKAYNGTESAASNSVTVTTSAIAPNAPTGLAASGVTSTSTSLTWTDATLPAGAAAVINYRVYSGATLMATTTLTSATVVGLTAATGYTFTVKAYNGLESSASAAVSVTTSAVSAAIKQNYGGMFMEKHATRLSVTPNLQQIWYKCTWAELNPQNLVYDFSRLVDDMAAHPGVVYRIHIEGGAQSPLWIKNTTGTLPIHNNRSNSDDLIPFWWQTFYKNKWRLLMEQMGAQFDSNPRIGSVNQAATSMVFDEPFIQSGTDAENNAFYAAGLDKTTKTAAIMEALDAMATNWPTTIMEMSVHDPFRYPDGTGQGGTWAEARDGILQDMHDAYGHHIIFSDYGMGPADYHDASATLAAATDIYSWMHKRADLGYPIAFQATLAPPNVGATTQNAIDAINNTIDMGGRWYEHDGLTGMGNAIVQEFDAALKQNVIPPPSGGGLGPQFVGVSTANPAGSVTEVTNDVPSGAVTNDLLLWELSSNSVTTPATPTGWNLWASSTAISGQLLVYSRFATNNEPASYTAPVVVGKWSGIMRAYRKVALATPQDVDPVAAQATITTPPAITTVSANALVVTHGHAISATGVTNTMYTSTTGPIRASITQGSTTATNTTAGCADQATSGPATYSPDLATSGTVTGSLRITSALRPRAAAPNAPTGLAVGAVTVSTVALSWTAATLPAGAAAISGYRVYNGATLIATLGVVTSTTLTGLASATPYSLTVRAYNGVESASSSPVNVTTPAAAGSAPRFVGATTFASSGAVTVVTNDRPAGIAANDILLWEMGSNTTTPTPTPAGWSVWSSSVAVSGQLVVFYRFATSSEAATYSADVGSGKWTGIIRAYRGVHLTNPQDAAPVTAQATATAPLPIVTVTDNALVLTHGRGVSAAGVTTTVYTSTTGTIRTSITQTSPTATNTTAGCSDEVATSAGTVTPDLTASGTLTGNYRITSALRPRNDSTDIYSNNYSDNY